MEGHTFFNCLRDGLFSRRLGNRGEGCGSGEVPEQSAPGSPSRGSRGGRNPRPDVLPGGHHPPSQKQDATGRRGLPASAPQVDPMRGWRVKGPLPVDGCVGTCRQTSATSATWRSFKPGCSPRRPLLGKESTGTQPRQVGRNGLEVMETVMKTRGPSSINGFSSRNLQSSDSQFLESEFTFECPPPPVR